MNEKSYDQEKIFEIEQAYKELSKKADLVYDFVTVYNHYIHSSHNYMTDKEFTMMEMHTLTYIEDNPGITVTELAKIWHKTKSAVSQAVKKLVENDYLIRETTSTNNKTIHLYVSEKGKQVSITHKHYDVLDITQTNNQLAAKCGQDSVDQFYKVLKEYLKLFEIDSL